MSSGPAAPPDRRIPIAVVGIGVVSPFGWGIAPFRDGLRSGRAAVGPFSRFDATRHRTRVAAEVPAAPPGAVFPRRASIADRFAIAAAREAFAAFGRGRAPLGAGAGVFFGSSTGGMYESEVWYDALGRRGGERARNALLASQQFHAPGDAVARELGACGPVETVSAACSSASMAIARGFRAIRSGEVDVAIAGGSDSLCRLTYGGFNALRSVDEVPSRPFRRERAGLSLGEGAAVLVLEPLDRTLARGAIPWALLSGAGESCDAHHMTAPEPSGGGAARAIAAALADAAVEAEAIAFVNAHGTGTPLNDAAEFAALVAVFGDALPRIPVTSTKSLVGHLLGSAGAIEAAATVVGLRDGEVHPMPDTGTPDPALPLDVVLGAPRRLERARHAVSTNLAFGGANAALVFSSWEPDRDGA